MKIECPNCGGNLIYVIGSEHVICEYCKAKVDVSRINIKEFTEYAEEIKDQKKASGKKEEQFIKEMVKENNSMDLSTLGLHMYSCDNCKSNYIHSNLIRGKSCPYCFCMSKKETGTTDGIQISKIIPFSVSKNDISRIICNSIDSNEFTPDNVFAMYVPVVMSYDEVQADGTVTIKGQTKNVSVKEKIMTVRYIGKSLDKKLVEKCVDYDFSKYQNFNSKLFNHSIVLDNFDTNNKRNEKEIKNKITDSINYDIYVKERLKDVSKSNLNISISNIKEEVWLLPIYVFKDNFEKRINTLLINGQNGRIVGRAVSHDPSRLIIRKLAVLLFLIVIIVLFLMISLNNPARNALQGCFCIAFIIVCFVRSPELWATNVKKVESNDYSFNGVSWDKEINIS